MIGWFLYITITIILYFFNGDDKDDVDPDNDDEPMWAILIGYVPQIP